MKNINRFIINSVILVVFIIAFPAVAYGYLDPGSGSYILQLALALLFGSLFVVKLFWNRIKIFLKNLFSKREKQ